jgi:hypothetical protein
MAVKMEAEICSETLVHGYDYAVSQPKDSHFYSWSIYRSFKDFRLYNIK